MSGRIRTVKPELLEDAVTAGLSETAFRLFIGMILIADDYGVLRAEPAYLAGQVFWKTPPSIPIGDALAELATKLVRTWNHGGQTYAFICNWEKHQKVAHRGKRRLPEPPDSLVNPSRDSHEDLSPDLRPSTSDQGSSTIDHRPATSARESVSVPIQPPLALTPPEPRRPARKPAAPATETTEQAIWRVFRAGWAARYPHLRKYVSGRDDGRAVQRMVEEINRIVGSHAEETGSDPVTARDELLAWWSSKYLQADSDWALDKKHPLYGLDRDLTEYGIPSSWVYREPTTSVVVPIAKATQVDPSESAARRRAASAAAQRATTGTDDEAEL